MGSLIRNGILTIDGVPVGPILVALLRTRSTGSASRAMCWSIRPWTA
jgi:hypothetical protein